MFEVPWPADAGDALAALVAALDAPLAAADQREHAIADAIALDRSRLAARLLQPGLFDRRAERSIAAQRAVLDEALARCRVRIADLARARRPRADRPRLAFAAIWR
jgi:hypothetical protein